MKPTTLTISTCTDPRYFYHNEEEEDQYAHSVLARELAYELVRTYPKTVTRVPRALPMCGLVPLWLPGDPVEHEYTMELVVMTPAELKEYTEQIRRSYHMEVATDYALRALTPTENRC